MAVKAGILIMRVLVAFDKFKDALPAEVACRLAGAALKLRKPEAVPDLCPLTDGGEGFARILSFAAGGTLQPFRVTGPRGNPVEGEFGLVPWSRLSPGVRTRLGISPDREGVLGVVEMASASGLARLSPQDRNPWKTTSRGTGELLLAAAEKGADLLLLGIGGSGTSDLGLGCLQVLGLQAWDSRGQELPVLAPLEWNRVANLTGTLRRNFPPIRVACDVTNPLLGARGAVRVYGPQKGLPSRDLEAFASATEVMAQKLLQSTGQPPDYLEIPGAGAAGGIGFGLMAFAGAGLVSGSDLVSDWLDLSGKIRKADVVLTGEGRFDRSSLEGKGPAALVRQALAAGKRVHVFAGSVEPGLNLPSGLSVHAISPPNLSLSQALGRTGEFLTQAVSAADLSA